MRGRGRGRGRGGEGEGEGEREGVSGGGEMATCLTALACRAVQHAEEEAKLTGQTELLVAEVTEEGMSQWLQEVQHLMMVSEEGEEGGGRGREEVRRVYTHLEHGVAVGIRNMNLQTSKCGVIVMSKVKRLNPCRYV